MSYRGRYVSYSSTSINHHDSGEVDSLGDRMWTDYSGYGPVQVYDGTKKIGPEFQSIFTRISGYRFTFASYIGGEQVLLLGDFIFLRGSSLPNSWYHTIDYTYLILADTKVSTEDILNRIGMMEVDVGVEQELNEKGHTLEHGNHISPFSRGVNNQISDNDVGYLQELYDNNKKVCTCGGAVRVKHDGKFRWLFPHPDGVQAAWDHMTNTDMEDDWSALMQIIDDAHPIERQRVLEGFSQAK